MLSMSQKTDQMLAYIVKARGNASVTILMKLAYLADLTMVQSGKKKISEFTYKRWNYGPFDRSIYGAIERLEEAGTLSVRIECDSLGNDYGVYSIADGVTPSFDLLSTEETFTIDELIRSLKGYGAKTLTDLAYKTAPMTSIGAVLGGRQAMGKELNLSA